MRRWMALAFLVLLAAAGCAGQGDDGGGVATANGGVTPTASATPTAAADGRDADVKFAQCMRAHGMSWFPDPDPDSRGLQLRVPKGQDKAKVDAAMDACKKFMPNGGEPVKMDAQALEQARQMAQCMRANGVPNFPDPTADGQIRVDGGKIGMDPESSAFKAAEKACSQYRPTGAPDGGPGVSTGKG